MGRAVNRYKTIAEIMQSLRRITKAIQNYSHEVSDKFGITAPQLWAVKTISQHEGLSPGELSQRMYLHPSSITGLIDRLEKKDFVERYRDKEDRRVIKLQLTPRGTVLMRMTPDPIQGKMIHGLSKLKRTELSSIHEAIQKLVEVMEVQDVEATFFFSEE
jgi:MarR family transcriptional regulator, organic hydroperoxide resistance regulator